MAAGSQLRSRRERRWSTGHSRPVADSHDRLLWARLRARDLLAPLARALRPDPESLAIVARRHGNLSMARMSKRKKQQKPARSTCVADVPRAKQPGAGIWGISAAIVVTLISGFYPFVVYPLIGLLTAGRLRWPSTQDAMWWMVIVAAVLVLPAALWVGFWFFIFRKQKTT